MLFEYILFLSKCFFHLSSARKNTWKETLTSS